MILDLPFGRKACHECGNKTKFFHSFKTYILGRKTLIAHLCSRECVDEFRKMYCHGCRRGDRHLVKLAPGKYYCAVRGQQTCLSLVMMRMGNPDISFQDDSDLDVTRDYPSDTETTMTSTID